MIDLHLHTHHSDGNWSPAELVERAIELRLSSIAITDHDTTNGVAAAIAAAADRIEIIPGVEINTVWCGPGGEKEDVHILGYFIDVDNNELKVALARQQEARLTLVEETIEVLSTLGIKLSFAQIQALAGAGSIGRPHITQAIVAAGGAPDVTQAYEKFMVRGSKYYIARHSIDPYTAVRAITASGGIASVAHPGKSPYIERIILELKEHGLKAIEAYHRRHSLNLVRHYIRFAHHHGLAVTGGSDCHGPFGEYAASVGTISIPTRILSKLRQLRNCQPAPCLAAFE